MQTGKLERFCRVNDAAYVETARAAKKERMERRKETKGEEKKTEKEKKEPKRGSYRCS